MLGERVGMLRIKNLIELKLCLSFVSNLSDLFEGVFAFRTTEWEIGSLGLHCLSREVSNPSLRAAFVNLT